MKKFSICFHRETTEELNLDVEAVDEATAIQVALDMMQSEEAQDSFDWESTDYVGVPKLTYCAEVPS